MKSGGLATVLALLDVYLGGTCPTAKPLFPMVPPKVCPNVKLCVSFNARLLFFLLKESRVWSEITNTVGRNRSEEQNENTEREQSKQDKTQ